jgi:hypothetical protein
MQNWAGDVFGRFELSRLSRTYRHLEYEHLNHQWQKSFKIVRPVLILQSRLLIATLIKLDGVDALSKRVYSVTKEERRLR